MAKRSIFKEVSWYFTGSFAYAVCMWLLNFVISKCSGEGNYADGAMYSLALSYGSIFVVVSLYGMRAFQVSDAKGKYADETYVFSRYITAAAGFITCVAVSLFMGYELPQMLAIVVFMVYRTFFAFSDVSYGIIQKQDRVEVCGKSMCLHGITQTAVFALSYYFTRNIIFSLCALTVCGIAVLWFYDFYLAKKYSCNRRLLHTTAEQKKDAFKLIKETFPLFLCNAASALVVYLPRIILERMQDSEAVAIFSYVYAPSIVITTFASSVAFPHIPRIAKSLAAGDMKGARKNIAVPSLMILAVGVLAVAVSGVVGRLVLSIMYDNIVANYYDLLMLCMAASSVIGLVGCCRVYLTVLRKLKAAIALDALGVAVLVGLCFLLIPTHGMYGTAYSILISAAVQMAASVTVIVLLSKKIAQPL